MLRRFFSFILTLLLIPILLVFLVILTLRFSVLNPGFYKSSFEAANLYERIPSEIAPGLLSSLGGGGFQLAPLTNEDIAAVLGESLPPEWWRVQLNAILDGLFSYLSGRPFIGVTIELGEAKARLVDNLVVAYNEKAQSLPLCSSANARQLAAQNQVPGVSCRISGRSLPSLDPETFLGSEGLAQMVPDRLNLDEYLTAGGSPLTAARQFYGYFQIALMVVSGVLVLLLLFLGLLNGRSPAGVLRWFSVAPLAVGGFVLAGASIGRSLFFGTIGANLTQGVPTELRPVVYDLLQALVGGLFTRLQVSGGVLLVVAVSFLVAVRFLSRRETAS